MIHRMIILNWFSVVYYILVTRVTNHYIYYLGGYYTMETFEIYFSDLNEDAQKRLLDAVGAESAADMNWDMDIIPIAQYDFEVNSDNDDDSKV